LDRLRRELQHSIAVEADVTMPEHRDRIVSTALEEFGRVDGLVNNAGVIAPVTALKETPDAFMRTLSVNLVAPFALAQTAAAAMRQTGGGSIVNVASVYALKSAAPVPSASYVASKAGLIGLTRELATQWGRYNIRVNALAPGLFPSGIAGPADESFGLVEEWYSQHSAAGRSGDLAEFQPALHMLVDPASTFLTGQVIAVDGGWLAQ
jgi:hypothetical protein